MFNTQNESSQDEKIFAAPGIAWATYDRRQAETVQAALQAQRIPCQVWQEDLAGTRLYLLHVPLLEKVEAARDFIWRDPSGLRLRPDWSYPPGAANESFLKWLEGE
jgi:hypothetical protein